MDRLKSNANKDGRVVASSRRPKPDRRWTLLFIGDHGKVVTLKRFKGLVVLATLVLCVSVALTVGLYLLNQNIIREKKLLLADLEHLQKQHRNLIHEKDILLARLVLAESRVRESIGGRSEHKQKDDVEARPVETTADADSTVIAAVKEIGVPAQKQSNPVIDQPQPQLSVAVENLQVSPLQGSNRMRLQFKIKNTTPDSQHVSGRAIIVLKSNQLPQNRWVSIPQVPLTAGKPTGTRRGHAFGINYFKIMRFTSVIPASPKKFDTAAVYVFTRDGNQLLEQDFPITLPSPQLAASTPSSSSTPPSMDSVMEVLKNSSTVD